MDMLKAENIKLNKNYLWDMLEIDWKEVTVNFNDNKINLLRVLCKAVLAHLCYVLLELSRGMVSHILLFILGAL